MATADEELADRLLRARIAFAKQAAEKGGDIGGIPPEQRAANVTANADRQAEIDQNAQDAIVLGRDGAATNTIAAFNQGLPFVGQYVDEAAGLIGGPQATEFERARSEAMARQNPKTTMAAQVAGGVVGSIPMAAATGARIIAAAPQALGARVVAGAAAGAGAGAIEGAVSGYGAGDNGDRTASAAKGAGIGAAFGGVIGGAGPAVASGIRNAVQVFKGRDAAVIQKVLGVSANAAKAIKAALSADDMDAAALALKRAGGDAMLADAIPGTLDTAINGGMGGAARVGRAAVESRAAAANAKLTSIMDTVLGVPEGIKAAAKGIAKRTSGMRQAAYDMAYAQPIDYAGPKGAAIEDVLGRVPPKVLSRAISEANDAMRAAGVKNKQIMATIADGGEVTFTEMPNVQQLDELKKALDDIARGETDALTGRMSGAGVRAKGLAKDLRAAVADAVSGYDRAVKLGGDKIAEDTALDIGRSALRPNVTRETVRTTMDGASNEARLAAMKGLRSYIDETLANVKAAVTSRNPDATEAMRAVREMSSRAAREKMAEIMGGARAKALFEAIDEATAHLELRAAVATNSATAPRLAAQKAIEDATAPGVIGQLAVGKPAEAMKTFVATLTGSTRQMQAEQKQALYTELAEALTKMRGTAAENALATIRGAMQGQVITDAQAYKIARTLTTGGALAAYQTGTRYTPSKSRAQ